MKNKKIICEIENTTPAIKAEKTRPTFSYAGIKIEKIDSQHHLVPTEAKKIVLSSSDNKAIAVALKENLPCLLVGETGTGKTSAVKYLAFLRKQPYCRVSMTGYTTPDELIGSKSAKDGSTYYEDGIITNAMKIGAVLVLDEINATPPDCSFILHGLLDDDHRITLPNGEVVTPHPDFRVFATMNPDYEGTKSINRAFLDRFPVILEINTLTPQKEAEVLVERGLSPELAEKLVVIATCARKAYFENKTITFVSTRSLLQVGQLVGQGLEPKLAYDVSVVKKARKNEQKAFTDYFNAVFKVATSEYPEQDQTPTIITAGELYGIKKNLEETDKKLRDLSNDKYEVDKKLEKMEDRLEEAKKLAKLNKKLREVAPEIIAKAEAEIEEENKTKTEDKPEENDSGKIAITEGAGWKLGDIAIAVKNAPYNITKDGWKGKVIAIHDKQSTVITVRGIIPNSSTELTADVETKYFINSSYTP